MKRRKSQKKNSLKKINKIKEKTSKTNHTTSRLLPILKKLASLFKRPSIVAISFLVGIILVIPTIIVMVPNLKAEQNDQPVASEEVSGDVPPETSNLSVPVMRSKTSTIEEVPLEDYVTRVVASEMPAEFEIEALKAQALAARTFIVNHLLHQQDTEAPTVSDTVDHQVYHDDNELRDILGSDYQWKMKKIKEAVSATQTKILTYNSMPITPSFFSTSNGFTENSEDYWESELPYLRSVESKWDEQSPKFLSQHTFTFNQIEQLLGIQLQPGATIPIEMTRTESNRVEKLKMADSLFTGRDVREKLELPSTDFSIEQRHDHFIFTTKGYGHGVGMSQYGANGMAEEGKDYKEIVSYYYKDVEISSVEDVAPALVVNR